MISFEENGRKTTLNSKNEAKRERDRVFNEICAWV